MVYFRRFELKYILHYSRADTIKRDIKKFFCHDKHGDKGKYVVSSMYYDSSDFRFYREKIGGEKIRSKLRLRTYTTLQSKNALNNQVFLEIKKRENRNVFKKKVLLSEQKARDFINNPNLNLLQNYDKSERSALLEAAYLKHLYDIRPVIVVAYIREAYMNRFGPQVRITFDSSIKYRAQNLTPSDIYCSNYEIPPDYLILEIKYNSILPIFITQLISKHHLILNTFSKYCTGIQQNFQKHKGLIIK